MYDAVIDEIDGRRIRVGDDWLIDYASCNYLGLDLDEEVMAAIPGEVRRWGTHPSWSRLLGNPALYPRIEERTAELLGAPDVLVLPTITHIHLSVIPVLAGRGTIMLESQAHKTIYDGTVMARSQGAVTHRFRTGDLDQLADLLRAAPTDAPRLVCVDGVNSMTGNLPDLRRMAELCRSTGALLYVDDAHGFGVVGSAAPPSPRRTGGGATPSWRTWGELRRDRARRRLLQGVLLAVGVPGAADRAQEPPQGRRGPYLYSGPSPVASLATVLAGLDVNERRGDTLRAHLHALTERVLAHLRTLRVYTPNRTGTPIIELPLAPGADLAVTSRILWRRGIYVTLAAYPLVPLDQVGIRVQLTAAHRSRRSIT
ncbi:aminotransferase class I/II-fold pyridoxal phosphate-dependent enzyme [Luedemannella flava]